MQARDVQINNLYPKLVFKEQTVQTFFTLLDTLPSPYKIPQGELSIVFLDDPTMAALHNDYLNDPSSTDVITFPSDPDFDLAGEICVCVDYAISLSQTLNIPFNKELSLYLIHGWLHLAGFNDITDPQIATMRAAEKDVLQILEKAGAIPDFNLQ